MHLSLNKLVILPEPFDDLPICGHTLSVAFSLPILVHADIIVFVAVNNPSKSIQEVITVHAFIYRAPLVNATDHSMLDLRASLVEPNRVAAAMFNSLEFEGVTVDVK